MQANFIKRVLTSQPHIALIVPDEVARPQRQARPGLVVAATVQRPAQRIRSIDQWQKTRDKLQHWSGVINVAPIMTMSALAVTRQASRSVTLTGVDPDVYFRTITIPAYIVGGQRRLTADDILIGTELATDLGVGVNDKISVSAASGASRVLTITGIFDLGSKSANERNTYAALRTAQALSGLIGGVTTRST